MYVFPQLVNEIGSYSVGVLRPSFLFMSLSASCLIHENRGKKMAHALSPCSCYPAFMLLISVCVCGGVGGGGGGENGYPFEVIKKT